LYLINTQDENFGSKTLAQVAAQFLMLLLPFSMIFLWCRGAYQNFKRGAILSMVLAPFLITIAALSSSLGSYSRAGFVIPMIAVAAVMSKRSISGNSFRLVCLGMLVLVLLLIVSSYRLFVSAEGVKTTGPDLTDISDMFQDYGTAPQYFGFLLQSTGYAENPGLGRVLCSSALSPVPIVGKSFREQSGNAIYGRLLGRGDQPATFAGELFLDFSVFGVIAGFLAVGTLVAILQNCFEASSEPLEVYVLQFASVCLSYFVVCGLEEVSQHATYLLWPIYCFLLYRTITKRRPSRRDGSKRIGIGKLLMTE
jgi:hypothetical protein